MSEILPQSYWANYAMTLGNRVKVLRMMRGLTQARLAEIAGVSRTLISNLERNDYNGARAADPTLSTLYRLAGALYVPPAVLLPGVDEVVEKHSIGPNGRISESRRGVAITLTWPSEPEDTARFAEAYLKPGAHGGIHRFHGELYRLE